METLVFVVNQHKHQYCTRTRSQVLARFNSNSSKNFRDISCRTFHATEGILPTPLRAQSVPVVRQSPERNTPNSGSPKPNEAARPKTAQKSTPIPIKVKPICSEEPFSSGFFNGSFSFSEGCEGWAGPTYSNSPPPSSLPIPKFLRLPNRSLSLDLPRTVSDDPIIMHSIAKSAPASPTREFSPHATKDLFHSTGSATKTLRRILNLDLDDE